MTFFCDISKATLEATTSEALPHSLSKVGDKICSELKDLIMCRTWWKVWLSELQRMSPRASSQIQITSRESNNQCFHFAKQPRGTSHATPKSCWNTMVLRNQDSAQNSLRPHETSRNQYFLSTELSQLLRALQWSEGEACETPSLPSRLTLRK